MTEYMDLDELTVTLFVARLNGKSRASAHTCHSTPGHCIAEYGKELVPE